MCFPWQINKWLMMLKCLESHCEKNVLWNIWKCIVNGVPGVVQSLLSRLWLRTKEQVVSRKTCNTPQAKNFEQNICTSFLGNLSPVDRKYLGVENSLVCKVLDLQACELEFDPQRQMKAGCCGMHTSIISSHRKWDGRLRKENHPEACGPALLVYIAQKKY